MNQVKRICASVIGFFAVLGFLYLLGFIGKFTEQIAEIFEWYFTYKYCDNGLNNFFSLIIKILVWIVPFVIANAFKFSNKKEEKTVSNLIATLVGMVSTVIFKFIQDYLFIILIILFSILLIVIIVAIIYNKKQEKHLYKNSKENKMQGENNDVL